MRILIVEDNRNLARGLRHNLMLDGHEVAVAHTGEQGLTQAREHALELILLDLMIPKPDGFEVLRTLRAEGSDVPIVVLTARGGEDDLVRALRLGADDYVTKPFSVLELLARVDAVRRRATRARGAATSTDTAVLAFRDVRIDTMTRVVTRNDEPVQLRPMEYELLLALARRRGQVASRLELLEAVWGYGRDVMSRTVDTHVRQLRQKLEVDADSPKLILTVRKAGYRLAG